MRDISRGAIGVRGIKLAEGEEVVGVGIIESEDDDILVLSENGYGKRSKASVMRPLACERPHEERCCD